MKLSYLSLIAIFPVWLAWSCTADSNNPSKSTLKKIRLNSFPYDLSHPDDKLKLPDKLEEISGMGFMGDGMIGTIQDEKGNIYVLDLEKGKIDRKIDFAKDGDFEGFIMVEQDAWIVRSDGKLYQVIHPGEKDQSKEEYKNFLDSENDIEGLCYDAQNNRLLLACKGSPGKNPEYDKKKAIYSFSLADKQLLATPAFLIDLKKVKSYQFAPSGIAIHPISGDIYVISAADNLLVVLDEKKGKVKKVKKLKHKSFKQPEGITFLPDGTMLIGNEGNKGKGNVLSFKYQP